MQRQPALPSIASSLRRCFCAVGGVLLLASCASHSTTRTSTERYDLYQNSKANAAAFGVIDSFTFGSPQEVRPANDYEFYFKECELTSPSNSKAFFSKTAYSCSDAPID
ncbi:MAG: hypothetical protein JNJ49_08085 [Bdellovibrionaceae bacterium]|nr:hypothetical protein [Pseudobdellovibrionaceae bacterium]